MTLIRLWPRLALLAVVALAAVLRLLGLDREGWSNQYYAATVQSMVSGWKPFFFACYDPECFVTVDKSPLGLWVQAAFAKVLGLSGVSLLLPQALAGIASVALLYVLVARAFGTVGGLAAALALAVMPVSVATDRNNTIDAQLVMVVLLAALAAARAAETGRLRWLIASFVLVGIGFEIKMLQAFLIVPAVALVYLLAAPHSPLRRVGHLAMGSAVMLAVALAWPLAVDLTPADQRPYVGGSENNSVLELITGHNGLRRIAGFAGGAFGRAPGPGPAPLQPPPGDAGVGPRVPRDAQGDQRAPGADGADQQVVRPIGGAPGGGGESGEPGVLRLFTVQLAGQASWLLPLALFGALAIAIRAQWRPRPDRRAVALVLLLTWLITMAAFFSVTSGLFHRYYLVMLAPAVAGLAGGGLMEMWRAYRERTSPLAAALPLALAATALVQAQILSAYPEWDARLTPALAVGAIASLALAAIGIARHAIPRAVPYALVVAAALALVIAPSAWGAMTIANAPGNMLPSAGPDARPGPPIGAFAAAPRARTGLGRNDPRLVEYLVANRGTAKWIAATSSSGSASPLMLETGLPVMALGGFGGGDRILDADGFADLVRRGDVRFVLAHELFEGPGTTTVRPPPGLGRDAPGTPPGVVGPGAAGPPDGGVMAWVRARCQLVTAVQVYDCAAAR